MRGVSRWASRVAPLLAVFVVLTAGAAWAEEPPDPPQARMNPPVGVSSQARLNPPSGAPMTFTEVILMWLQSRISIPNG